jgi:hypothetical protein
MADSFVDVEFTKDPETLADDAVARLQERWVGWEPNEADQEVVMIETLAPMAAEAAEVASDVPASVFREYGTKLVSEPYLEGIAATALLTITVVAEGSPFRAVGQAVTVPAGTEVLIDNAVFAIDEDATAPAGQTIIAAVSATAVDTGAEFNGLVGDTVSPLVSQRDVVSFALAAPTTGGQDEELDDDYQDRLGRTLQLQAKTLVTTRDFELWALIRYPNDIGRAVARHLGARHLEVTLTDLVGEVVPAPLKAALAAEYQQYRLANTTVDMVDATYTVVDVDYAVKLYPTADPVDAIAAINALLTASLSPELWGSPRFDRDRVQPTWFNDPIVRKNKLIDLIGDVEGVDYVDDVTIAGAGVDGNLALGGAVALPRPGAFTGTVV